MRDLISELDQGNRTVADADLGGVAAHVVELRRRLRAPVADVWDTCTNPERVRRWFLPLSGDLRPGGRFQLEGNAGGTITTCTPPHQLKVTWEVGDAEPSLLSLDLTPAGDDATDLVLRHTVPDDDHWAHYGPGAVGVGWDLPLVALAILIAGEEPSHLMTDPSTPAFMRLSATAWGAAHQAAGATAETARRAASLTSAFYAPEEEPDHT